MDRCADRYRCRWWKDDKHILKQAAHYSNRFKTEAGRQTKKCKLRNLDMLDLTDTYIVLKNEWYISAINLL